MSESGMWQVWVETGGTFTDCIAVDPAGATHCAKVLSSSRLRGALTEAVGARRWRVQERWNAPTDFIRGQHLWLMDAPTALAETPVATIITFDAEEKIIELDTEITISKDAKFEVRFPFEAPVLAARLVTRTLPSQSLPPMNLRVGTTRGTNALLTRRGVSPAFFVTAGFADLLEIGTQQRPDLFALDIQKPRPLYGETVEVNERLDASGAVLRALDEEALSVTAGRLVASGVTTAAVALLHSYRNPVHEQRVAEILRSAGFTDVSLSSHLSPFIKAVPRAETAVVNAYLSPIIESYLAGIRGALSPETMLHVMTSAGGLVGAETFLPKDSLLSGPAGGIVGAARAGERAGFPKILAFDMGGTSTDVARFDGVFDYVWEHRVGDARLVAPALAIESVAAGGGSICTYDHQGLRVGPESAGASPGPACYGAGGPLTITDVNLLLGRILPGRFDIPLLPEESLYAADALVTTLQAENATITDSDAILEGVLDIANERMADAIRRVSVRQGYDPTEYALLSFGGAGGQHACAVAERLGVHTVLVPPDASLLSAWGIGQASVERFAERQILRLLDSDSEVEVIRLLFELGDEAVNAVAAEGVARDAITVQRRIINLRLAGQETTQSIEFDETVSLLEAFARRFETVFGYRPPAGRPVEIESVRVVAASPPIHFNNEVRSREGSTPESQSVKVRFAGGWQMVPFYEREELCVGQTISGPALIAERHSITVVETGWECRLHPGGTLILTCADVPESSLIGDASIEAVASELFAARFAAIAEEMGEKLRQNSISTNVKERLDFSCALLGPDGALISTAAHIPVHLGALGACVRRLREMIEVQPGDVIITNHPGCGGSHLPDVTVVTPVFDTENRLLGYVANRAHHAEIGGTRPGSMPPRATNLREEGVVISPTYLVRAGESCLDDVCRLLETSPYPSRAVADNRADLEASLAANRRGAAALIELAAKHGAEAVWRYMDALTGRAERLLHQAFAALPDGEYAATEYLDDGTPLTVTITILGDRATVDFTGTGPTHPGNLNATPAIAASATLYVLRLLVGESLPLNEGLLRPVTLILPENTLVNPTFDLNDPARCPAVVGGNTETSQRLVDTLLKALGLAAGSQGTMNNVLWGTDAFGYYETVCGGAGATPNAPGAHAVHTHMTNTRITDVEIVERRYPVRIERFSIRSGSGGVGQHRGGDGIVRETTFLAPMALSVLTQHRTTEPFGLAGGENGLSGRQRLFRETGEVIELGSVDGCEVLPRDRLILETPGGGGWGEKHAG